MDKERFENGTASMDLFSDGNIWVQVGIVGFYINHEEFADLYELMTAYIEDVTTDE